MNGYGRLRRPISNGVKKTLKLAWGVIRRPAPTFRRIKEERPLGRGIAILLVSMVFGYFILSFVPEVFQEKVRLFSAFKLPISWWLQIPTDLFMILLAVFFLNLAAIFLKGKGNFGGLLISLFCINVLEFIEAPLLLGASFLNSGIGYWAIRIVIGIWSIGLILLAVRELFGFSIARAIGSYFMASVIGAFPILPFLILLAWWTFPKSVVIIPVCITLVLFGTIIFLKRRERLKRRIVSAFMAVLIFLGSIGIVGTLAVMGAPMLVMYQCCVYPMDVAIDDSGNLYAPSCAGRVHKFNPQGNSLLKVGRYIFSLAEIDLDGENNIYIVNNENSGLKKYDSKGNFIENIPLGLNYIYDLVIDAKGNIYVKGRRHIGKKSKIFKFDNQGNLLFELSSEYKLDGSGEKVEGPHCFMAMALDKGDNLYISYAQKGVSKVTKLDSFGNFLNGNFPVVLEKGAKEYWSPEDIAIGENEDIHLLTCRKHPEGKGRLYEIRRFNKQGEPLLNFSITRTEEDRFTIGREFVLDDHDNIYTTGHGMHSIEKFSPTGEYIMSIGPNPFIGKIVERSFFEHALFPKK